MSEKKAFVFDTNFIIQNKDLNEVFANLSEQFAVYVTQVSIDERISQQRLDAKQKFDALPQIISKYRGIAKISEATTIEKEYERIKTGVQKNYTDLFGDKIIPFSRNDNTFSNILHRVYEKQPPFVAGESDRGFKDTLLWLSLLDFFKAQGESDVVFVTDDKGFRNSAEVLGAEFKAYTEKTITIQENSYYKSLLKENIEVEFAAVEPQKLEPLPDVELLRERIHETICSLYYFEEYDRWNGEQYYNTFTLKTMATLADIENMFRGLRSVIQDNLFETDIPANKVIPMGDNIVNEASIPIGSLQAALALYEDIRDKMAEYLPQFYSATMNIINRRYKEEQPSFVDIDDDDDLPF